MDATVSKSPSSSPALKRGLKNRHIQLIALGGAIGTGLFLSSAGIVKHTGPAMILGYLIGGIIEFFIMRQLGEMVVEEPVAGSFSHFAYKYWSKFAGFMSGWNYWALYVLAGMAELTAVAKYVQYWYPGMPQWVPVLVCFVLINAINLANVRIFGEAEFWFAIIKVAAVVGTIVFGAYLLWSGGAGPDASVSNLWVHGGFFTGGFEGFAVAMVIIMFSFGGLELVGVGAAEADEPQKTIPKAINQVIFRILIFYVGVVAMILILKPWPQMVADIAASSRAGDDYGASPFVLIMQQMHIPAAAHVFNFIILTAALSVYNSGVYCNSRMLYGLALKGNAPRMFKKVDRRGVPVPALCLSALGTGIGVIVNLVEPDRALPLLLSLVVASLIINWSLITITHLKFRSSPLRKGRVSSYLAWGAPVTNYVCLAFLAFLVVIMATYAGMWLSVVLIPVWLSALAAGYWLKNKYGSDYFDSL